MKRRWGVSYALLYPEELSVFTEYYRTKMGAIISIYFHYKLAPLGGTTYLFQCLGEDVMK